jgi:hypothetical protein
MMNDIARTALPVGHLEGLQHELAAKMVLHGPTHHAATKGIDHHNQVEEASRRWNVGDVGDPQRVGSQRGKAALHQIAFTNSNPCRASNRSPGRTRPWLLTNRLRRALELVR